MVIPILHSALHVAHAAYSTPNVNTTIQARYIGYQFHPLQQTASNPLPSLYLLHLPTFYFVSRLLQEDERTYCLGTIRAVKFPNSCLAINAVILQDPPPPQAILLLLLLLFVFFCSGFNG